MLKVFHLIAELVMHSVLIFFSPAELTALSIYSLLMLTHPHDTLHKHCELPGTILCANFFVHV